MTTVTFRDNERGKKKQNRAILPPFYGMHFAFCYFMDPIPNIIFLGFFFLQGATVQEAKLQFGDLPALTKHMRQEDIEQGKIFLNDILEHGEMLFQCHFNKLDGQGRPRSKGNGIPRSKVAVNFTRISGPDSNSCSGCHAQPRIGGAGDIVANVFVLAQNVDPIVSSIDANFSNERNTLGMFGSGPMEMLAREMSCDLISIREDAKAAAKSTNLPVTRKLVSKGVSFGEITVLPNGKVDPREIEGVDWDLIVKPFHQKGAVVSLREFANNAMNHHHGMQAVEKFGKNMDPDEDGVFDELTVGDITAITLYQAFLNTPGQIIPHDTLRQGAITQGEKLFSNIGCAVCHIPVMQLKDAFFTEPNPFNPPGNLTQTISGKILRYDMSKEGPQPRLEPTPSGGALVRAFTDLKRHNLNDQDLNHFANEKIPQGTLNGFATPQEFTEDLLPRPVAEFLTAKLWDVGSSMPYGHGGDLTTISEAIHYHGGEARESREAFLKLSEYDQRSIVEFLKSLRVLPDGSARITYERNGSSVTLSGQGN